MRLPIAAVVAMIWAGPSYAFEPVPWITRCIEHVDSLPPEAPILSYEAICASNPIGMCRYSSDPAGCLMKFQDYFLKETSRLEFQISNEVEGSEEPFDRFRASIERLNNSEKPNTCPEDHVERISESLKWHPPGITVEDQCALYDVVVTWSQWRSAYRELVELRGEK